MIKFCTFFTNSHLSLYKEFMNSFPYEEGVDLIIRYLPQESDGVYESDSWNKTMFKKMVYIVDYLKKLKEDEYLIHADIDICFYKNFKTDLMSLLNQFNGDILFQNDGYELSMGFFICKKNEKIISLMEYIRDNLNQFAQDQKALNVLIPRSGIKYGILPERYYNFGPYNGFKRWEPNIDNFYVPRDIILHHANWTVGIENKLNLIKKVKEIVKKQNDI